MDYVKKILVYLKRNYKKTAKYTLYIIIPAILFPLILHNIQNKENISLSVLNSLIIPLDQKYIECQTLASALIEKKVGHYSVWKLIKKYSDRMDREKLYIRQNYFYKKSDVDLLLHLYKSDTSSNKEIENLSKQLSICQYAVENNLQRVFAVFKMNDLYSSLALARQKADNDLKKKNQKTLKDIFVKYDIPKFYDTSNIDAQIDLIHSYVLDAVNLITKENNLSYDELRNKQICSIDYNIELGRASINFTRGSLANWQKYYELANQKYNEKFDKLL